MLNFLYTFGFETPRQRRNNAANGWDDENSHCVHIDAPDAAAALAWGDRVAQRYVAVLCGSPEVDWSRDGYASWVEPATDGSVCPHVKVGEYPDFTDWLATDST